MCLYRNVPYIICDMLILKMFSYYLKLKFTCFLIDNSSYLHVLECSADTTQMYTPSSHILALLFKKLLPSWAGLTSSSQSCLCWVQWILCSLKCLLKMKWVFIVVVCLFCCEMCPKLERLV